MNLNDRMNRLHVEAQLSVELDGQSAYLTGQGNQLRLTFERGSTLRRMARTQRPGARQTADRLAALGLTLTLVDQQRPLFRLGHDVSSSLGRLLFGSRHLELASLPGLLRILLTD